MRASAPDVVVASEEAWAAEVVAADAELVSPEAAPEVAGHLGVKGRAEVLAQVLARERAVCPHEEQAQVLALVPVEADWLAAGHSDEVPALVTVEVHELAVAHSGEREPDEARALVLAPVDELTVSPAHVARPYCHSRVADLGPVSPASPRRDC